MPHQEARRSIDAGAVTGAAATAGPASAPANIACSIPQSFCVLREGTKVALFSFGARLAECLKAADELAALGLSTTVADARFAKPLDTDLLLRLAREHEVLITIEEGAIGGFAAQVLHFLADNGVLDNGLKVRAMVLPDIFIDQDSPAAMYATAGLDAKGIVAKAFEALGQNLHGETVKLGRV